ncbi:hypothetical protein D9M70_361610 [compost metagenome]
MKVARVPKPMEPRASAVPLGAMRRNTLVKGSRSPWTMGAGRLGQASSRAMAQSRAISPPMLHSPSPSTITTPSGAPMATAP